MTSILGHLEEDHKKLQVINQVLLVLLVSCLDQTIDVSSNPRLVQSNKNN